MAVVVGAGDVRLGHPHRDRRRELGVEARLPVAHAGGDDLLAPVVVRRQLAEHRLGRVGRVARRSRAAARARW